MIKERIFSRLRAFNLIMAVLHVTQGSLMLMLSNDFRLPLTTAFIDFDVERFVLVPVMKTVAELPIGPLVAAFLFLSALAHLLVSMPGIHTWYVKNLKNGANYARWIEYSVSSSLMIVVVALLVGMYDAISLMLMFGLNVMMILFGWLMELHNQSTKKTNWTSFIFGTIAGIIPWIAIAIYLGAAGSGENRAPDFVYWIFFSIFVVFNVFAINMFLQYKKIGKWRNYIYGETIYILLSLIAKSLLAWQVFAGTLRPV